MSITYSWDDLWAYYNACENVAKAELLAQIDWNQFMSGLSSKYQIEVLKNAPDMLKTHVKKCLYLDTVVALNESTTYAL